MDVLDISYDEARHILFAHPLCDGRFRVSPYSLGFWLLPTGPHERAAQTWQSQYAPVVKELCRNQTSFSGVDFAKKAAVPFSSAQYILSMLVKNGLLTIQALENGGAATFSLNRKRRRVIRAY
ncbi:hypothetical protein [Roseomonas sp. CECT 9278]|uniref:hypothetical protein n=1 Tax=Roseomonas sp. CECT 9278 TaxID=2845823 RepID=UPI001E390C06|nr:hypothetical protein [Roseomonas sp. CECT 9278]